MENIRSPINYKAPLPERTVRVTLPYKIATDLKAFKNIQASIHNILGYSASSSERNIRYEITR